MEGFFHTWAILARSARVHALRMSDNAKAKLSGFGLDYTGPLGDSDEDLRYQWRYYFETVNDEPCPF